MKVITFNYLWLPYQVIAKLHDLRQQSLNLFAYAFSIWAGQGCRSSVLHLSRASTVAGQCASGVSGTAELGLSFPFLMAVSGYPGFHVAARFPQSAERRLPVTPNVKSSTVKAAVHSHLLIKSVHCRLTVWVMKGWLLGSHQGNSSSQSAPPLASKNIRCAHV